MDARRLGDGNERDKSSDPEPSRIKNAIKRVHPKHPPAPPPFLSSAGHNMYLQIVQVALKTASKVQRALQISFVSCSHK